MHKSIQNRILSISLYFTLSVTTLTCLLIAYPVQANEDSAWQALKQGNAIAVMRHAYAPDTNETSIYEPQRCEGERNLSKAGVEQAKRIAQTIRLNGIESMSTYSSSLCRCIDTGNAFEFGPVENLPLINSYFQEREKGAQQTIELKQWIINAITTQEEPIMLITHGLNVSALTNVFAEQGDVLILSVDTGELKLLHRLNTPW